MDIGCFIEKVISHIVLIWTNLSLIVSRSSRSLLKFVLPRKLCGFWNFTSFQATKTLTGLWLRCWIPSPGVLPTDPLRNKNSKNEWVTNNGGGVDPSVNYVSFMVHMSKMIISLGSFFIFSKCWFCGLLERWKGKKWPNILKNYVCPAPYLRNHTSYDCQLWYTYVKWYLQAFFFSSFNNFDFMGC